MRYIISCLVAGFMALVTAPHVRSQYWGGLGHYRPFGPTFFRSGLAPQPSFEPQRVVASDPLARFLYVTVSVTLASSTSTTTVYSVTYCTTSTSALKVCTPSGRRRRGIALDNDRGLYYNEEGEEREDGSIFLPSPNRYLLQWPIWKLSYFNSLFSERRNATISKQPHNLDHKREEADKTIASVPSVVQPGLKPPSEVGTGRFIFVYRSSVSTVTSTSTIISALTAICKSTSSFQLCGVWGK